MAAEKALVAGLQPDGTPVLSVSQTLIETIKISITEGSRK